MTDGLRREDRLEVIREAETEARRWTRLVDSLVGAFQGRRDCAPQLVARMEALRNKRDTVVTKVEALKRHRDRNWFRARLELEEARRELDNSWRTVISTLNKEGLFV